ncbi:MAG TPA: hypothetical protein H9664_05390 [Firmicutes bacterium]|nr:hypothetical protein [Bacillota bacterium]
MIKLENTSVMNLENALRGARNPMASWERSDSFWDENHNYILGPNDLSLARRLCTAGPDHRKFIRQIFLSVDITAPLYWWKEFDTYKVGTVANSTSTMHKIHSKPFALEDFSTDKMNDTALKAMNEIIAVLENLRKAFIESKDKQLWYSIIQLLPSSYNQKRTCSMNYENLINMYYARRGHKLDEWRDYCSWIETLPYAQDMLLIKEK